MKKVFAWVKEHPLTLVLIAGVVILLLVLLSGSSGSTQVAAGQATDPNAAAELQASTQVTLAGIGQATQIAGYNASITAQQNTNAFQLAQDTIQSQTAAYQSNLGAQVSLAGIGAQKDVQLAGIQGQVQLADLQNQVTLANADVYKSIFTSQETTKQTIANDTAAVQISGIAAQKEVALAPYQVASTAISSGNLNLGVKDAYLSLPGISTGRATNFTPPGASAGQPNPFTGFLTNLGNGLSNAFG